MICGRYLLRDVERREVRDLLARRLLKSFDVMPTDLNLRSPFIYKVCPLAVGSSRQEEKSETAGLYVPEKIIQYRGRSHLKCTARVKLQIVFGWSIRDHLNTKVPLRMRTKETFSMRRYEEGK
jgi:hypothetical protein